MRVSLELLTVLEELTAHHEAAAALGRRACDLAVVANCSRDGNHRRGGDVARDGALFVSTTTCTVEWQGHRCVLGPSLPMRLIHRLSRHPERFFTYGVLMESVWQRKVSDDAVRTLVKRLRRTLRARSTIT